jgi:hypothetical protein
MKKIMLFLTVMTFLGTSLAAQSFLKKGSVDFAAGVGLVPTYIADGAQVNVLPLNVRLGVRVSDNISMAAFAAYSASEKNRVVRPDESVDHVSNKQVVLGVRSAVHALRAEKFDIYGGVMLGYNMPTTEITNIEGPKTGNPLPNGLTPSFSREATNSMVYSGFVGAAYRPGANMSVFTEIGYGISLLNVGMQWKLR